MVLVKLKRHPVTLTEHFNTGVGPPFALRTVTILHNMGSTRYWKHSFEILVRVDVMTSCNSCIFSSCKSPIFPHPKSAIGFRSGELEGH